MEPQNRALVIVDVQPTFCEGGALGVAGGNEVAERIADFVTENADEYEFIVTTQDWHIEPGNHFSDDPDLVDTWPPHGVADTAEAELHEAIASLPVDCQVKKGQYSAAYSGFEGTDADGQTLENLLRAHDIQAVDVVGLAESHCVKETALDALHSGWPVRVFSDLTAPVSPELGEAARVEMDEAGIEQLDSSEAFGFYEEEDDGAYTGEWDLEEVVADSEKSMDWGGPASWTAQRHQISDEEDLNRNGIPDDLEDDEYGAADYQPDEFSAPEAGTETVYNRDHYGEYSDPELTTDGEDEELYVVNNQAELEDLDDLDLSDFDLDIDEDADFSDEVSDDDLDFSDVEFDLGSDN